MSSELLEIQPQELSFIFELKKQSTCSVRLVNKSNYHVAFKVKTTAPKKYGVRPMTGIIKPKSTCNFVVTMRAQVVPPDSICKDKFLLLSTVVPVSTTEEDITSSMFIKDGEKYIEEKRLKVVLVNRPLSPVPSPNNGTSKQAPVYETSTVKDDVLSRVENLGPNYTDTVDVGESKMENVEKIEPVKDTVDVGESKMENVEKVEPVKDTVDVGESKMENVEKDTVDVGESKMENVEKVEPAKDTVDLGESKMENVEKVEPVKVLEVKTAKDVEELNLVKDIEEMKSKLNEIELKLSEAEVTISKLTEERRLNTQEMEIIRQELVHLSSSSKRGVERVDVGFPLLFVCMVALVNVLFGYILQR